MLVQPRQLAAISEATKAKGFDMASEPELGSLLRTLAAAKPGGLYVVDDLRPLPAWPEGHAAKVEKLLEQLSNKPKLVLTKVDWSTGCLIAAKRSVD